MNAVTAHNTSIKRTTKPGNVVGPTLATKYHYKFYWVYRNGHAAAPYSTTTMRYTEDEARNTFGDRLVQPVMESLEMIEHTSDF